jgi:hypothetical protein
LEVDFCGFGPYVSYQVAVNKALSEKRTSTAKKEPAFPVRCLKKNQLSQRAVGKKN